MLRRPTAIALALAAALTLGACGGTATADKLDTVPVGDIQELVDAPPEGLVVLDIRTAEEFATGHLENAVNIDYYAADFENQLSQLDLEVPYIMYCNSGNRSSNALALMDSLGFTEVYELDGGIQAWYGANLPVEQ
jgi:rhodanese-related sulfurtransferase